MRVVRILNLVLAGRFGIVLCRVVVQLIYSKWRSGLRLVTSFFLNHDCATKRTYMEIKTRILLLGILSILYGLFVTDIKYPRIDELRCYIISLNVPMLWWQKLVQNGGRPPYSSSSIFKIMIVPLNGHIWK